MMPNPTIMPQAGERNIGPTTLGHSPSVLWVAGFKTDHLITDQSLAAEAKVAPQSPPISAWLELEGRPSHHVNRFQAIAARSAASSVVAETKWVSTRPWPIVLATAVPRQRPQQIENRGQDEGLARGQDFGGNGRGDGVGRVVEAIDVLEDQRHQQDDQNERHGDSGMLQGDVGDDIAGVPAAVDDFFQQFV